ncbi:unnamed protein product [Bursaphelenchus okinawaensis]|uniref:BTB domain-containing protein n=1 Tax=Bursaphelenchus okinawaensis TaxID=465554 RepID=A0A811KPZ0_9BILA|nr:unnamed protein product [Bursaphelenchus okinawaensis]CAG9107157.1 unnamed protein product [Bursaphelenchus okinawaensis]
MSNQNLINANNQMVQQRINELNERVSLIVENPEDNKVFNDPNFCDYKVKTDAKTFYASKLMLAQKSNVFKAMFTSGMQESQGELVMGDDADAVEAMLLFIHQNT